MPLRKDIWRIGAVRAPLQAILRAGLEGHAIHWLADSPPLCFLADPFGLWRDGVLHVFAEAYDYRTRRGVIEVLSFDTALGLRERRQVVAEPWHLSYPYVFEHEGETYMLPEAFRSGHATVYRAVSFPHRWEPAHRIMLDHAPIDATPLFHDGLWWLFYTPATTRAAKVGALHVAYAPRLGGPWTPHPRNPVRLDPSSSRPGGTPIVVDGVPVLPMQDCRRTYGGAVRPLTIEKLTPAEFAARAGDVVAPPDGDGLHTLAAAGPITLLDVKRFHLSPASLASDVRHLVRQYFG